MDISNSVTERISIRDDIILIDGIKKAVRKKAQEVEKFRESGNGVIRIRILAESEKADHWLGGKGKFKDFEDPDIANYEFEFAITPGGRDIVTGTWDGVKQQVSCYGYSALKIAHCALAIEQGKGQISGLDLETPYLKEDNGFGPEYGALCVPVLRKSKPFCKIFVCVSGADSEDDLKCAIPAIKVIKGFFESMKYGCFKVELPRIPQELRYLLQ